MGQEYKNWIDTIIARHTHPTNMFTMTLYDATLKAPQFVSTMGSIGKQRVITDDGNRVFRICGSTIAISMIGILRFSHPIDSDVENMKYQHYRCRCTRAKVFGGYERFRAED